MRRYEMDMRSSCHSDDGCLVIRDRQMNGSWSGKKTLTRQTGWIRQTGRKFPVGHRSGQNICLTVNFVMIWLTVILFLKGLINPDRSTDTVPTLPEASIPNISVLSMEVG